MVIMIPATYDIEHRRGDVFELAMRLKWQGTGEYVDLSDATVRSQVRDDPDGTLIVEFDITVAPDQVTDKGSLTLAIDKTDSEGLPVGLFGYDIEVTIDGSPETFVTGAFTVDGDYTHD
jgi:hypothetical protein